MLIMFFFSSRRRHTRFDCDWSSDVCSSDLHLIGPAALAAVSTAGFYVWVLLSLGEMVEVGLIAVAARRHGEGRPDAAARAAGAAVLYALAAGTAVSLVGLALTDDLFRLMAVPPAVARLGHAYLHTWLLGGPLGFGFFAVEATFPASGATPTPFRILTASVLLSIGLDPLLISGWGPFPRLGVEGAATASVMVRGGGFLIGAVIALRRGLLRLGAPDWRAVPTIFRVGAPLSLAGVLLSLIYMWLTRFTSRFGTPALAALGVGHKVEGIGFMAISGFALSASALVGQNLGARQDERARQAMPMTAGYCLLVTTATAVALLSIPSSRSTPPPAPRTARSARPKARCPRAATPAPFSQSPARGPAPLSGPPSSPGRGRRIAAPKERCPPPCSTPASGPRGGPSP